MGFIMDNENISYNQIRVVGVGGGGGNAINGMVESGIVGVEFLSINTDRQILENSKATHKIQIGVQTLQKVKQLLTKQEKKLPQLFVKLIWYLSQPVWAAVQVQVQLPLLLK